MREYVSFDDVLIIPRFTTVKSRKDVSLKNSFIGIENTLPIISSNMDSVTSDTMARAMKEHGAMAALHRFLPVADNVNMYLMSPKDTIVSIGIGKNELERFEALYDAGARNILIDVAHGGSIDVVNQIKYVRELRPNGFKLIVGNFATKQVIEDTMYHCGGRLFDAAKVGIGGGSACLTRVVTGCGLPTLYSVMDCSYSSVPIIADGGCRNSGDICKALAAGASAVMLGGMLAGAEETPGTTTYVNHFGKHLTKSECFPRKKMPDGSYVVDETYNPLDDGFKILKSYRGSASEESYRVQGKVADWRSPEGDSFLVPYSGPVVNTLRQIEGGLRSSMSYVNAHTLDEYRRNAQFARVTQSGYLESKAHGRKVE